MRLAVLFILAPLLSGCFSPLPVEELRRYDAAFSDAQLAANTLFDDLAIAEQRSLEKVGSGGEASRNVGRTPEAERERLGYDPQYYPDEGLDIPPGDPERTATLRRAMSVVAQYNDILLMLAEGRTVADIKTEVSTLKGNAGALLSLAGVAQGVVTEVAAQALTTVLESAERARSRKAFQDAFLAGHEDVLTILSGLRTAAPEIYAVLIRHYAEQVDAADFADDPDSDAAKAIRADAVRRINAYREAVRSYEAMFARVEAAFGNVRQIMEAPQTVSSATLNLAQQTAQIRTDISDMRRAFALLRAGPGAS